MTESQLREQVVSTLRGWVGWSETNGGHRRIIDIYNGQDPIPVGYRMSYSDDWCAATVSAAAIVNGITDVMPTECSCIRMIELYKAMGRWQESDAYRPQPGDLIMYDWEDSGKGDNVGMPNHVGVVESVKGDAITVLEGNYRNAVGRRTIAVDGRYIRGYCLPDYAAKAAQMAAEEQEAVVEDNDGLQTWQRNAIAHAVELGISDGSRPLDTCTRVDAMQMAVNVLKYVVNHYD